MAIATALISKGLWAVLEVMDQGTPTRRVHMSENVYRIPVPVRVIQSREPPAMLQVGVRENDIRLIRTTEIDSERTRY